MHGGSISMGLPGLSSGPNIRLRTKNSSLLFLALPMTGIFFLNPHLKNRNNKLSLVLRHQFARNP